MEWGGGVDMRYDVRSAVHSLVVLRCPLDGLVVKTPVLAGEAIQLFGMLQTLAGIPRVHVAKH